MRLDQALVQRGLLESREKAQRAILAGQVRLNGQVGRKSSDKVKDGDAVELVAKDRFVSRGGHKIEHALTHFQINPAGLTCIDIGSSTGGFTDCLLQHGATRVYAVDVGKGQLAWTLRQDPRVVVMEETNARFLTAAAFGPEFAGAELLVADCSFISLRKVLPPVIALLKPGGRIAALIKPQFEAGREEASRGAGVITDPIVHERVISELHVFAEKELKLRWSGLTESPLLGPAGNKEFLVLLEKTA
jgi:23S rRNA (cytidine1920-2'-O)/16S rRNA (cytidine1409-2'-O)-methyltransferase